MAAEDELVLPQVPEAKPDDPEDVSWALSTAEAMWARGDHSEGIKWVRKAAEAASDAEDDMRALELAKAASELANIVARRSRASHIDPLAHGHPGVHPGTGPPPPTFDGPGYVEPISNQVPSSHQGMSGPPPPSVVPVPMSQPPPVSASQPPGPAVRAPIPLPSKASSPPPGRGAPRPLAANSTARAPNAPQGARGVSPNRTAESKSGKNRRRSRENLDNEARAAGVLDTSPQPAVDGELITRAMREDPEMTAAVEVPATNARVRRRSRPDNDGLGGETDENATVVARLEDLERHRSAEEWDASPTENLTGDEMEGMSGGDRATAIAQPPVPIAAPLPAPAPMPPAPRPIASKPPAAKSPSVRPPTNTVHDPEIQTSQAVRVVVWRDATGVHLAPAGTVVSSIVIDAVLVVLEPGVDLTAWLSQRDR